MHATKLLKSCLRARNFETDCKQISVMKVSRAEYDRLLESSPGIDQDIIALFNKRFNASYPNVSKPIICNGLQEVQVYRDSVSAGGEEESTAENAIP